jgi:hypothetical protein
MTSVTDEEYHLTFGLHSGIPLCCAIRFADGEGGGPCPKCVESGLTREEWFANQHQCDENTPACQPYIDLVELRTLEHYKHHRSQKPTNLVKGELDDYTWGCSFARPLGEQLRNLLQQDGYRMVHICWPEPKVYWYIYQQVGGKKAICGICNTKFSLAFPTTGKQAR